MIQSMNNRKPFKPIIGPTLVAVIGILIEEQVRGDMREKLYGPAYAVIDQHTNSHVWNRTWTLVKTRVANTVNNVEQSIFDNLCDLGNDNDPDIFTGPHRHSLFVKHINL